MPDKYKIEEKKNFRVTEKIIDSDKLVFVFTGMGTKINHYKFFISRLNRQGYSAVIYDYPVPLVYEADYDVWREFYDLIIQDAQERIHKFKKRGYTKFYTYGVSMGSLIANKLTRDTPEITHVALNLTYGDVATNIWSAKVTNPTKMTILKRGGSIDELREQIKYTDPITNAAGLKGKKVLLHLARLDRVLLYKISSETKKALEKAGVELLYEETKYAGHTVGGMIHMLRIRRLKKFFDS